MVTSVDVAWGVLAVAFAYLALSYVTAKLEIRRVKRSGGTIRGNPTLSVARQTLDQISDGVVLLIGSVIPFSRAVLVVSGVATGAIIWWVVPFFQLDPTVWASVVAVGISVGNALGITDFSVRTLGIAVSAVFIVIGVVGVVVRRSLW